MANKNPSVASSRLTVNIFSFTVTCCILFAAVVLSDSKLSTRINEISVKLNKAIHDVMDSGKDVHYTEIDQNFKSFKEIPFHPRGMAGLYNVTQIFINLIITKNVSFDGLLVESDGRKTVDIGNIAETWHELVLKYAGLLAMCIVLLLLAVCMPFCGFCFCCCRCCGNCGARSQPCDKKHDLCKKITLATLLICLGTVLLFIVVCSFASNQQLYDGINDLPQNVRNNIKDLKSFMDHTGNQFDTLLVENYGQFAHNFLETIDNSSEIVYQELAQFTDAVIMTNISDFADRLIDLKQGFVRIKNATLILRQDAHDLDASIRRVRHDLLLTLQQCSQTKYRAKCDEIMRNISNFRTQIDFDKLPDISSQIKQLDQYDVDITKLHDSIQDGKKTLLQVEGKIKNSLNNTLEEVRRKIADTNITIMDNLKTVKRSVSDADRLIYDADHAADDFNKYVKEYGKYQYYVGLGISCLLLLISLCIMLGLICGICGKRPDVYGDDCCNKGAGSQFLICGVMLMFTCGFLFAIVVIPFFLVGVTSERLICDPVRSPNDSSVFDMIDYALNPPKTPEIRKINLRSILLDIQQNKTLYYIFKLEERFNLSKLHNYLDEYNGTLSTLHSKLSGATDYLKNIQLDQSIPYLERMMSLNLDVDFDKFEDELTVNFTTVSLTALSDELNSLIQQIDGTLAPEIRDRLINSKVDIDRAQEDIVVPMTSVTTNLIKLCKQMKADLSYGDDSFKTEVDKLINNLRGAQDNLRKGQDILINITVKFANSMVDKVRTYIDRVIDKTQHDVGKTGPVNQAMNNSMIGLCDKVLLPFNGFWFVLFWSIILFIPTIIVAVKLATLYQKYSPYSAHLVETEYLYDAYADRDNIPLNSRSKHRKKKNKKNKNFEERTGLPTGGGDMVSREYAAGSHQDARYADMAPKHWEDFPAGGPPQYQRAPTEYERPPPYYYPGTGTGDHK